MTYFHAIILSIVEGFTEFLPVSSTGHLILVSKALSVPPTEFLKSFEVIIQLGAILAVLIIYKNKLIYNRKLWSKILVGFIPTGIVGFLFYKIIREFLLGNEIVTVLALLSGGIVIILVEYFILSLRSRLSREKQSHEIKKTSPHQKLADRDESDQNIENVSYKNSFLIGVFQSISIIPGVSRAAATIIGGRLLGLNRKTAVQFSFVLAIPTMLAATILDLVKSNFSFSPHEYGLLATGLLFSFIVAILSIKFFIKFVESHTFIPFGIYRIVLAILYWLVILS